MGKPKSGLQQDDLTPSTLPADHTVVQLGAAQGSGNYLSLDSTGAERLVELSGRVKRSKVIVTRGDYAFVRLFPDGQGGSRVMGEVVGMISGRDVKTWRKTGEWPQGFDAATPAPAPVAEAEPSQSLTASEEESPEADTVGMPTGEALSGHRAETEPATR